MNSKNIKILILTLALTFTLPIVTKVKADTFTYIDNATIAKGGAGVDSCNCLLTLTMQTNKESYLENPRSLGGGEEVYVTTSLRRGSEMVDPPNTLSIRDNANNVVYFTQSNDYNPYIFEIGKDQNGNNYWWEPGGNNSVTAELSSFDTSNGLWLVNYSGNYQDAIENQQSSLYPVIFFSVYTDNSNLNGATTSAPSIFVR